MNDYLSNVPNSTDLRDGIAFVVEHWRTRNNYIKAMRLMLEGLNPITAPQATQYKVKVLHLHLLSSVANEKTARFLHQPQVQVVPNQPDADSRKHSSRLEKALEAAFYEIERNGDGDVWSRIVFDAICFDQGVERMERAPAAFWPEATLLDDKGNPVRLFESDDELDAYKKIKGLPIRSLYVAPEAFHPIYEGPNIVESYEFEYRSLRSILRNKLFAGAEGLSNYQSTDLGTMLKTIVPLVHYTNHQIHAYYMMSPVENYTPGTTLEPEKLTAGEPILLHSYNHKLGRVPYNVVAGRFGGWKTSDNRIEGINKGIMELNQAADEISSQMMTYVRATKWPTNVFKVNPEMRGYGPGQSTPQAPQVPEGQNITIFTGEEVAPLFTATDDPQVMWLLDQVKEQIARLGGSPVLFGQRQPGVETGYHANLQITQSEHLDEKIEQHLAQGAIGRANLFFQHIKAMDERVWCHVIDTNQKGSKSGEYISIDPKDLVPMPRMDASVRKPRPVDFAASLRSAREASDDRGGKGPLLSDDTIRGELLARSAPDEEEYKIMVQEQKTRLRQTGLIDQLVAQRLNLKLAEKSAPETVDPTAVDPAIQQAMMMVGPQEQAAGGGVNLPSGMPAGQSQPEANAGYQMAGV